MNNAELKKAIYRRRPVLKEIMKRHGGKKLYDYARDFLNVNPAPGLDKRKPELVAVVQELLAPRLRKKLAKEVADQLRRWPLVSTSDHHGIIGNPFFLNSNIVGSLHPPKKIGSYLIDFSFACISLNNSSYPRCFEFHGEEGGKGPLIRLPLLPNKLKEGVVHATRAITSADIDRAESQLRNYEREGLVTQARAKKIHSFLESIFKTKAVLSAPDFNTQITRINYQLWPQFFRTPPAVPNLIYLEIETLVSTLILEKHISDKSSLIHPLLADPTLFWGIDEKGHRLKLEKNKKWNLKILQRGLQKKRLYPGSKLCYLLVALYYGIKCLGGFCQVHDLTNLKKEWQHYLISKGQKAEARAIEPIQTKELSGDGMVITPGTGLDLALSKSKPSLNDFRKQAKQVTLEELMEPMLPIIHHIVYPLHVKKAE